MPTAGLTVTTIARVLIALPPYYLEPGEACGRPYLTVSLGGDVPHAVATADCKSAREWRLTQVADVLEGYPRESIAQVVALGKAESGYAAYVWAGCHRSIIPKGAPDCDRGRALGYWQLHQGTCPAAWGAPPWTAASLREQVACVVRLLEAGKNHCAWVWRQSGVRVESVGSGAFGYYAGRGCNWLGGARRSELSDQVMSSLLENASRR